MYERLTQRTENGGVKFSNGEYWNTVYPQNENCLTDIHRMAIRLCELEEEPKGDYEVLRATKEGRKHTLIAYSRLATNGGKQIQHLTLADRDMGVVIAFLKKNTRRMGNDKARTRIKEKRVANRTTTSREQNLRF